MVDDYQEKLIKKIGGLDKVPYFSSGAFFLLLLYVFFVGLYLNTITAFLSSLLIIYVALYFKEYILDPKVRKTKPDRKNILATIWGSIFGVVSLYTVFFAIYVVKKLINNLI